jgi:predicted ATP-grasp superfamily ATP-dependent carboligase
MGATPRVLVPAAGGPGAINMTRSLKLGYPDIFTAGLDASPWYIHLAETDVRGMAPRWSDEDQYLEAMEKAIKAHSIDLVFPNNSVDGEILSRRGGEISARTFLPSTKAFHVGESKWASWQVFKQAGLPVPKTWLINDSQDMAKVFQELETRPIWVRGAGIPGKGVGVASLPCKTLEQAIQWVDYWNGWGGMIASEFLPGDNLTWLGLYDHGQLIASQCRQRDAYVIPHVSPSGITGAPAVSHTVINQDLNRLGPAAVMAVDPHYHGPAFVDFKGDVEGAPRITEINVGRFGTTHHFYSVAGANFPCLLVALALGLPRPSWVKPTDVLPEGLYWIRTLDAIARLITKEELERGPGTLG